MILQALNEYYLRKSRDPDSDIAPEGFEWKAISFLILIDKDGRFINIEDTREKVNGRLVAKSFLLPRAQGRSGKNSYKTTFLLWDHIGYVLGLPNTDNKSSLQHQTWIGAIKALPENIKKDEGIAAVLSFYENGESQKAIQSPMIEECLKTLSCNMTFRLVGDVPVPCRDSVQKYVTDKLSHESHRSIDNDRDKQIIGTCIVTGMTGPIIRIHGATPINKDAKSLVGIQKNSGYDSYGKEQGYNAPMLASTEFAYVTALNTLLKSPKQRMQLGNMTVVFWSERRSLLEEEILSLFSEPSKDNPDAEAEQVKALFRSIGDGSYAENDSDNRFYLLGLSPNAARISVRLWQIGTVGEFSSRIKEFLEDFTIVKPPNEPEYYSLWRILVNIAVQDKSENIPPNIAGEFMRSILSGIPYPATMLQAGLRRIRSDTEYRVKPVRAALIKAYLNRYYRFHPNNKYKEVNMSLDINQPSVGYQTGRLFATLEKIQEEANPGINATIRERYYGAACTTPAVVYPNLLRLKNHHLAKIDNKAKVIYFEKLLGAIINELSDFPAHLNLHEQGLFAIGYYHQRQAFFEKKTD
ncbi:MAG: type I-C CRISPR-associated protein Cas8c/Csd1 [Bacteroidales bacterium]|nr:type I-C CRISPR-associated protein Cas8c/Csd1 [Bacteroidales bacterium]